MKLEDKLDVGWGGEFELKVYANKKDAGIDLWSLIKKFFGYNVKLGIPLKTVKVHNKMTNASLAVISGLIGNTGSQTAFGYAANGSSATAVSASHTTLQSENSTNGLARMDATESRVTTTQTNDTLRLTASWTATGAGGTIEEVGIFNASSSGVMLCRALTGTTTVASGQVLNLTYNIKFVGN